MCTVAMVAAKDNTCLSAILTFTRTWMAEHGFGYLLMHSGTSPILIEHVVIRFIFPEHVDFDILALF